MTKQTIQSIQRSKNKYGSFRYVASVADGSTNGTELVLRKTATRAYEFARIYTGDEKSEVATLHIKRPSKRDGVDRVIKIEYESANDVATAAIAKMPEIKGALPEYVAQDGEVKHLTLAITLRENTLLTGPTGCGKTHLVMWLADKLGREVVTIQGGDGMTPEHMIGYRDVVKDGDTSITTWRDGLLTQAMRRGAILYCDEPNALPEGIRFYLFSAMDMRREITLAENGGEVVKAKDGFLVIGAMNEGAGYTGTSLLSYAFRARFGIIIDMHYLSPVREASVLHKRTGCDEYSAGLLSKVAADLRKSKTSGTIKVPIGTRSMLSCASLIAGGMKPRDAASITIVAQVPVTASAERKAVSDVFAAYFK